jgi:pilus assembly protein Flp/PilA
MKNLVTRFVREESGATAIEYGLIAALISVVIIGVLTLIGGNLVARFTEVANALGGAGGGGGGGGGDGGDGGADGGAGS